MARRKEMSDYCYDSCNSLPPSLSLLIRLYSEGGGGCLFLVGSPVSSFHHRPVTLSHQYHPEVTKPSHNIHTSFGSPKEHYLLCGQAFRQQGNTNVTGCLYKTYTPISFDLGVCQLRLSLFPPPIFFGPGQKEDTHINDTLKNPTVLYYLQHFSL